MGLLVTDVRYVAGVRNQIVSRRPLERAAVDGDSPVSDNNLTPEAAPEYCGARGIP